MSLVGQLIGMYRSEAGSLEVNAAVGDFYHRTARTGGEGWGRHALLTVGIDGVIGDLTNVIILLQSAGSSAYSNVH